jgi:hypothetical protein
MGEGFAVGEEFVVYDGGKRRRPCVVICAEGERMGHPQAPIEWGGRAIAKAAEKRRRAAAVHRRGGGGGQVSERLERS